MGHWTTIVITATVPAAKVCKNCLKSAGGCKERKYCTDYAVERLVRGFALMENQKTHGVEYDIRRNAARSGRLRERQY